MNFKYLLIISLVFILNSCSEERSTPFNSDEWKSSGGELILTDSRIKMTGDLLEQGLLISKTEKEIEDLIGLPNKLNNKTENHLYYIVQEVYSTNIDPDEIIYIEVTFDELGKSNNAELLIK